MDRHVPLPAKIALVLAIPGDQPRSAALRQLAASLAGFASEMEQSSNSPMRDPVKDGHVDELDIAAYAEFGHIDYCAKGLAAMLQLPPGFFRQALLNGEIDLLIVICRSLNFAWSTVRFLIRLHGPTTWTDVEEGRVCEDYHGLAIESAARLTRFIRVQMRLRGSAAVSGIAQNVGRRGPSVAA